MTTARDAIQAELCRRFGAMSSITGADAESVRDALLSALEAVRLELVAKLNPWQPIEAAPKDRPILAWMWGAWRVAKWDNDRYCKKPRPHWVAEGLSISDSRFHQPKWWIELPAPLSEDKP